MLLKRLQLFIANNKLIPNRSTKILLTVSGGVDSMVMLHLFRKLGNPISVAHCNFKLRDEESDDDESMIRTICNEHSIPFYSKSFETKGYSKQKGISTQMAARELRYAWFKELVNTKGFNLIATAHHLNDSLETSILNLVRGTGISGLSGISPKIENIIRPLLFATKNELLEFAQLNQIAYREDTSNASIDYERNFIRHEIIPRLKKLNPSLEITYASTEQNFKFAQSLFQKEKTRLHRKLLRREHGSFYIYKKQLAALTFPSKSLYELIGEFGFNSKQCDQIIEHLLDDQSKEFLSATHRLIRDRKRLTILPIEPIKDNYIVINETESQILFNNKELRLSHLTIHSQEEIPKNRTHAVLNSTMLEFPLLIRKWKHGDYFYPFGMNKKKKISRFLIDEKASLLEKENTYVLCSGNKIAWLLGHRIDNRFKVPSFPKEVLHLNLCNAE